MEKKEKEKEKDVGLARSEWRAEDLEIGCWSDERRTRQNKANRWPFDSAMADWVSKCGTGTN